MQQQDQTALASGTYDIPKGHLAVVVTHMVCAEAAEPRPQPPGVVLRREDRIEPEVYRMLFRMVGRDWLWTSRLMLEDDALVQILLDPSVTLYTLQGEDGPLGIVELDQNDSASPEISFFGLVPAAMGRGIGGWLMGHMQQRLFRGGADRIRLNTCTLDSPNALKFYMRSGFRAERRDVQVFPDPRAVGLLDEAAAPFVPRT